MNKLEEEIKEILKSILKSYDTKNIKELNNNDWNYISAYRILSENFIEKYQNKVNWTYILQEQELSNKFFKKYCNRVSLNNWRIKNFYSKELKEKIEKYQKKKIEKEKLKERKEFLRTKELFNNKYRLLRIY